MYKAESKFPCSSRQGLGKTAYWHDCISYYNFTEVASGVV